MSGTGYKLLYGPQTNPVKYFQNSDLAKSSKNSIDLNFLLRTGIEKNRKNHELKNHLNCL